MRSDVQKIADLKYEQSEKGKAASVRCEQSEAGKAAHARYAQTEVGKITNALKSARYAQTERGKVRMARAKAKRKRNLGFKPINNWFPESEGHHIDKENVLFIPAELHKSIPHSQDDLESMQRMNDAAFEWFYIEEVI